jgi:hypothetical protein
MGWTQREIKVINQILGLLHKHNIEYVEDLEKIILEHKEFIKIYKIVQETHIVPKAQEDTDETR